MNPEDQDPLGGSPEAGTVADPNPDPGVSTVDWDSDENPWKKRFDGYRPEADRKITRLSQYEQAVQDFQSGDPEEMRRAAAVLGIADYLDIEEPEPPTYDDPEDELRAQYAALEEKYNSLEGKLTAKEQKDLEAQQHRAVESALDQFVGKDADEQERNVVLGAAFTLPLTEDGLPNIEAAAKFIEERDNARMRAWGESKRAPRSIQPGQTATQQKNVNEMTEQELIEWGAQRLQDMNDA